MVSSMLLATDDNCKKKKYMYNYTLHERHVTACDYHMTCNMSACMIYHTLDPRLAMPSLNCDRSGPSEFLDPVIIKSLHSKASSHIPSVRLVIRLFQCMYVLYLFTSLWSSAKVVVARDGSRAGESRHISTSFLCIT